MPSSPGSPGGHSKRSNLFVLRIWRVWREDVAGTLSSTEGEDDGRGWQWEGRIQRAVSGQEHHFQGWPDFIEILEEMLADAQQVSGRSHRGDRGGGHTATKRDGKPNAGE